jgi:serine protease AprX
MTYDPLRTSRRGSIAGRLLVGCVVFASLAMAVPAAADGGGSNGHRARLSADLSDHLNVGSQAIRVIAHGTRAEVDALAARYNLRVARYLASGAVFVVNAGQLEALRQDDTQDHLSGDVRLVSSVDAVTIEAIGADQVAAGSNDVSPLTGRGITVALIDSGIDTRHNALKKRVLATKDFTGGDGVDRFGHGTHVAAIIAGQQGRSDDTRDQRGIAPGAWLLNLRVLGDDGSGFASDVIEAIDWTVAHRLEYNVRVINLSLGAPVLQPYRDDPLCEAVERAVRAGIVVVAAAGNYGRTADGKSVYGAIASPGNSPYAITVGALDTHGTAKRSDDTLAPYSSKGPTRYDLIVKPDVAAPGSRIASAAAADSYLAATYPERHVSGSGPNAYMQLSGTSMAAGVVSGAVAVLLEQRGNLRPAEAKAVLQLTSSFMPVPGLLGAGAGAVNVIAATQHLFDYLGANATRERTTIAGESQKEFAEVVAERALWSMTSGTAVVRNSYGFYTQTAPQSILWGARAESIIWGASTGDSIIWGAGDSIIWGALNANSIIWGASGGDSIIWGANAGDSIIWGAQAGDSIIWGANVGDSIIWGANAGDSIIWGADAGDSIIWGANVDY